MGFINRRREEAARQRVIEVSVTREALREARLAHILGMLERAEALQEPQKALDGSIYTPEQLREAVAYAHDTYPWLMPGAHKIKAQLDEMALKNFRIGVNHQNGVDLAEGFIAKLETKLKALGG